MLTYGKGATTSSQYFNGIYLSHPVIINFLENLGFNVSVDKNGITTFKATKNINFDLNAFNSLKYIYPEITKPYATTEDLCLEATQSTEDFSTIPPQLVQYVVIQGQNFGPYSDKYRYGEEVVNIPQDVLKEKNAKPCLI